MPLYAIRTGRWVEIRSGKSPPRKQVSRGVLKGYTTDYTYRYVNGWIRRFRVRGHPLPVKASITTFVGGRFLGSLSYEKFKRRISAMKVDEVKEITGDPKELLS